MRTLSSMLLLALIATGARAQHADPSGTWAVAPAEAPSDLPGAPSGVLGPRFGLNLAGDTVTLIRAGAEMTMHSVLSLGGPPAATAVPGAVCMGERRFHETAAWEGDRLVLTITAISPAGGGEPTPVDSRFVVRMDGPDRLVVEATMVQQGERRQVGSVYRRTDEALPPRPAPLPIAGTPATIDQVAWLGTTWIGTTGTTTTEERWTPPASGSMLALARTLRGEAMAAYENLCIVERSGTLVYMAMPNGRLPATPFVATEVTPTGVTFENPAHDYPQWIRYERTPEGGLATIIAGPGGEGPRRVVLDRAGGATP